MSPLTLVEATPADLDRIMALESAGFAPGNREARDVYAQRIDAFPQGSLMAYLGDDCVGCVFSEIWHALTEPDASHFTLGHDILDREVLQSAGRNIPGRDRDAGTVSRGLCPPNAGSREIDHWKHRACKRPEKTPFVPVIP